jgi:hypothetical protein
MKYRIEVQQVFTAQGYDRGGEWLALGDKPRGKAAAIALMETIQAASGLEPPYRVVSVDALGDRVEVARIESPHKPAPKYAVEVTDAQGEKRQEFESLPLAMQMYTACVDGAENDPRKGYTRRVALVGIESGDTYYKWEYLVPQAQTGANKRPEGLTGSQLDWACKQPWFHACEYFNELSRNWIVWAKEGDKVHPFADFAELQAWAKAKEAQATKPVLYQVFEKATGEAVGKKYHNRNGAENYCDGFHPYAPGCYEVRQVQ